MLALGRVYTVAAVAFGAVGSILVAHSWGELPGSGATLGFVFLVLSGVASMAAPLVTHRADLARSFEAGWEAGYHKGRRATHLKVVRMDPHKDDRKGA